MSEPYTPTTDEVRSGYADGGGEYRDIAEGWFDRWLDQVKADARREGQADAWDEGYRAGADDMSDLRAGRLTFQTITSNPYRQEATR